METTALLRELTEACGASGYEAGIREAVGKYFAQYAESTRVDTLGNIVGFKKGQDGGGHSVMLAAHMDEIALMVNQIEKGFLRVAAIGGFDPRVLIGQEVVVHGRRELSGVIVSVPPHFTRPRERDKTVPLDKLFVDLGLSAERVAETIRVGDIVTIARKLTVLTNQRLAGRAFDDRAGLAAIIICLEEMRRRKHLWDILAVATVQEEVTRFGAATSAYHLRPDVAIAIDGTFGDQPGASDTETYKLDGGPTVAFGPNIHPAVYERLVAAAEAEEIPFQIEPIPGDTGTDGWAIQISRSGLPTGVLGIPLRYMHSSVETLAEKDVLRTGRLLAGFISRLDQEFSASMDGK